MILGITSFGEVVILGVVLIIGLVATNKIPAGLIKSFVFFIQTLAIIPESAFPSFLSSTVLWLDYKYLPLACIFPSLVSNVAWKFVMVMVMPWLFIILVVGIIAEVFTCKMIRPKKGKANARGEEEDEILHQSTARC